MAMNTVYFRALHLMRNTEYRTLRAGLRMTAKMNPGVNVTDFELWSLTVSAIHGCGACLNAHETALRQRGVCALQVQAALRIASVMAAAGAVMRAQAALTPG
jgi:alkyl hydroperoxide reductase subunit D